MTAAEKRITDLEARMDEAERQIGLIWEEIRKLWVYVKENRSRIVYLEGKMDETEDRVEQLEKDAEWHFGFEPDHGQEARKDPEPGGGSSVWREGNSLLGYREFDVDVGGTTFTLVEGFFTSYRIASPFNDGVENQVGHDTNKEFSFEIRWIFPLSGIINFNFVRMDLVSFAYVDNYINFNWYNGTGAGANVDSQHETNCDIKFKLLVHYLGWK